MQTTAFFACGSSSQLNTEKWLFLQTPVEATIERSLMEISIENHVVSTRAVLDCSYPL